MIESSRKKRKLKAKQNPKKSPNKKEQEKSYIHIRECNFSETENMLDKLQSLGIPRYETLEELLEQGFKESATTKEKNLFLFKISQQKRTAK